MSRFSIGTFQFVSLSRAIAGPRQKIVREIKSGQDGCTFWLTGKRAEPFWLTSVADAVDCSAAEDLYHQYENLIGSNPVPAIWAGKILLPLLVMVLDVQDIDDGTHQTLQGIGGTLGSSHGLIRCQWLINPVIPVLGQ